MYLAKIRLPISYFPRITTGRSASIPNRYDWHQKLWECFPNLADKTRKELGFLTRIDEQDGVFWAWVLSSSHEPIRPSWCPAYEYDFQCKKVPDSFLKSSAYHFDVICNPTRILTTLVSPEGQKHKKRIAIEKAEDLKNWLLRKASEHGFEILGPDLEINQLGGQYFKKEKNNQVGVHNVVQFKGKMRVTNQNAFVKAYQEGIGAAKGFGFGMLLLKPIK